MVWLLPHLLAVLAPEMDMSVMLSAAGLKSESMDSEGQPHLARHVGMDDSRIVISCPSRSLHILRELLRKLAMP